MGSEFNITSELKEKTLIIKTDGYINNTGGEIILQEFSKHYSNSISNIILDLEKSKVVNSIGISYLIELIEQINQNNGKIFFTNLDPAIEKTFKIMGLFQYAEKTDSSNSIFLNK